MTLKLGFLVSHGGTSMRAIVDAIAEGRLDARAQVVISNNGDAPALNYAKHHGISTRHISTKTEGSGRAADVAICRSLQEHDAEWVVMSGYLRKLGPAALTKYRGRILNIHPALLPKFGGQGMYGRNVHEAVLAAGETVSGMTVHFVDEEYDRGAIVAQHKVPVLPNDTVDTLQQRITTAEPPFFVEVLRTIASLETQPSSE